MRKINFILILLAAILCNSCQDVVDINVDGESPRLVFDAILKLNEEMPRDNRIRISTTASFFDEIQPSLVDRIQILNETQGGVSFYAPDSLIPGDYIPGADNIPNYDEILLLGPYDTDDRHILTFEYLDELYLAFANYIEVPEITSIVQGTETLFDDDDIEIIITFNDPEDETNFYVFEFGENNFVTFDDSFFNGEEYTFSYFLEEEMIELNEPLRVNIWGVDEDFHIYIDQLIDQSEEADNPFFQIPVTTVRGNILKVEGINNIETFDNVGRPQEFVLGYFGIIQERSYFLDIE
ncbi:MAG: DUF4249 family protein [bacterium]